MTVTVLTYGNRQDFLESKYYKDITYFFDILDDNTYDDCV